MVLIPRVLYIETKHHDIASKLSLAIIDCLYNDRKLYPHIGFSVNFMPNCRDLLVTTDLDGINCKEYSSIRRRIESGVNKAIKKLKMTSDDCPGVWLM